MSSVERAFNSFIVSAADIEPAEHEFLLEDKRFPIGEVSIIAGAGGAGKGQLACAHISYTSMGCNLDGDRAGEPKNVFSSLLRTLRAIYVEDLTVLFSRLICQKFSFSTSWIHTISESI